MNLKPQELEPQVLLSTNLDHTPSQMLNWFVRRWRMEVTFEEARAHLGIDHCRWSKDISPVYKRQTGQQIARIEDGPMIPVSLTCTDPEAIWSVDETLWHQFQRTDVLKCSLLPDDPDRAPNLFDYIK